MKTQVVVDFYSRLIENDNYHFAITILGNNLKFQETPTTENFKQVSVVIYNNKSITIKITNAASKIIYENIITHLEELNRFLVKLIIHSSEDFIFIEDEKFEIISHSFETKKKSI